MNVADTMRAKLTAAFAPRQLEVFDESQLHAGHSGARPGGQTHFRVVVVADTFRGLDRVTRQRRVLEVLGTELVHQVHALAIRAVPPEESR